MGYLLFYCKSKCFNVHDVFYVHRVLKTCQPKHVYQFLIHLFHFRISCHAPVMFYPVVIFFGATRFVFRTNRKITTARNVKLFVVTKELFINCIFSEGKQRIHCTVIQTFLEYYVRVNVFTFLRTCLRTYVFKYRWLLTICMTQF